MASGLPAEGLAEQVTKAVEAHATTALPALFKSHGLAWDAVTHLKMARVAATQIHQSIAARGATRYELMLPDGRPHEVRLAALDKYLDKLVEQRKKTRG